MIVDGTATGDCVPQRETAGVASFSQPIHLVGVMVCEIARDATDGIVDCGEFGEMREAVVICWPTVCRLGEVWKGFAWARISHSQ